MDEVDESSQCEVKEFKGFKKSEMKPTANETSVEEEEEDSKDVLPNGTGKKDDSNKTEEEAPEDVEQEMSIEEEEDDGFEEEGGNVPEQIKEEAPEENENSGVEDIPNEEPMEFNEDPDQDKENTPCTTGGGERATSANRERSATAGRERGATQGRERNTTQGRERITAPARDRVTTPSRERVSTPNRERVSTPGRERSTTPGSTRSERLRSSSSETPPIIKKSIKLETETNCPSSDEEDFLGFDVPAMEEFEKDKSIRSSVDEPESVDSDAGGTPYTKGQTRGSRAWKKTVNPDLSNPEYLKPFEHGWVRELVYRSTSDSGLRRHADIYYFTPKGKKVRSFREVAEHLTGDLTVENFTFFKDPIGIGDPDKEIIREAKAKPNLKADEIISSPVVKKLAPKSKPAPLPTKASKSNENATPKSGSTPRVVFKGNVVNPKNKTGKSKFGLKGDKKRKSAGPDDMEIEMIPAGGWSPELKANVPRDVCSIECRLAMGLIPTLQCHLCLCLYHPQCVGCEEANHRPIHSYVCKRCQVNKVKEKPGKDAALPPPPPLTPMAGKAASPPKKDGKASGGVGGVGGRSIVGAVTTWLPPSSSVQVSQPCKASGGSSTVAEGPSQSVVSMNGKQYVVVHHSVAPPQPPPPTEPPPSVLLIPYSASPPETSSSSLSQLPTTNTIATQTNGVKRLMKDPVDESSPSPPSEKKPKIKESSPQEVKENKVTAQGATSVQQPSLHIQHHPVVQNFMMNLNAGFSALLHSFQYLKVHELLRASCVSHMWHHIAQHRTLWETVRMKNSRVRDWEGFGRALSSFGTKNLDLKKMLLPETAEATAEMWVELSKAVAKVSSLRKLDLGKCTPEAVESIALSCPQLESIISLAVRGTELTVTPISTCMNLTELKLKSIGGIDVKDLTSLKSLTGLKHLSLTTIKNLAGIEEILTPNLETLELGECSTLSKSVATVALPTLVNLRRLRLEKGMDNTCPTQPLLNTIANLPNLTQLELINFDVKPGFDKALAKCTNLKTLLIIPTYVTQSATTNHVVIGGVSKLSSTLTYFVWGLTLELLRVTDLFIDQVEGQKGKPQSGGTKKGSGDSIPILKPIAEGSSEGGKEGQTASQVDILALPKLQKVLSTLLPTTKIKILKVPFSATWRQTVSEVPQ